MNILKNMAPERASVISMITIVVAVITFLITMFGYVRSDAIYKTTVKNDVAALSEKVTRVDSALVLQYRQNIKIIGSLDTLKLHMKVLDIKKKNRNTISPEDLNKLTNVNLKKRKEILICNENQR